MKLFKASFNLLPMNNPDIITFISDGFEKAKRGDAINVYNKVARYEEMNAIPLKSHYPYGWIIYYALLQSPDNEIQSRKKMLAHYFQLQLTVPHKLHSMILTQAIRLYKDAKDVAFNKKPDTVVRFSIINFLKIWNLDNLRPGDWKRKDFEGKKLSSTTEKLITLCVDELEETHTLPGKELLAVIDKAVNEYPDSFSILSQRAAVHILANEKESAAGLLRKAILAAPGKFYLWNRLAATVSPTENPRLYVALLYKALSAPGSDQFKGKIRISLADVLSSRGAFSQALWELNKVKSLYSQNQWHLSPKFNEIMKRLPDDTIPCNPECFYKKMEFLADEEIYAALPSLTVTKTYHKKPSTDERKSGYGSPSVAWRVTDKDGNNYWINPRRFNLNPDLPLGCSLTVWIINGKVVKAEQA